MPEPSPSRTLLARPSRSTPGAHAADEDGAPDLPGADPQGDDAGDGPDDRSQAGTVPVAKAPVDVMRKAPASLPDIVIDVTGAALAPSDRRDVTADGVVDISRHRRMLVVLGAVAMLAAALAVTNFVVGMQWRSQALADQDRAVRAAAAAAAQQQAVVQANTDRDAADLRRQAMAGHLAVSEADVAALEARLLALANDRAQAEDHGDYAAVISSRARMRTLRAQVDSCLAQVAALRTSLLIEDLRAPALQEMAVAAEATCEQIGADVAVLASDE